MRKNYGPSYYRDVELIHEFEYDKKLIHEMYAMNDSISGCVLDCVVKDIHPDMNMIIQRNINDTTKKILTKEVIRYFLNLDIKQLKNILKPVIDYYQNHTKNLRVKSAIMIGELDIVNDDTITEIKINKKYNFTDHAWIQLIKYNSMLSKPRENLSILNLYTGVISMLKYRST